MGRRLGLTIIMGLLLCALPAREFPELLHLSDNTSNDYSTQVFQGKVSSAVRNQAPDVPKSSISLHSFPRFSRFVMRRQVSESLASSPDFLHLLCVQRT